MINHSKDAMTPEDYLINQATLHPAMRPQDMIKLCYQAVFGAEHLVRDEVGARKRFDEEFAAVSGGTSCLFEWISPDFCRVNLSAWKQRDIPPTWLFQLFVHSTDKLFGSDAVFSNLLEQVGSLCAAGTMPFSSQDWNESLAAYWCAGGGAVHHSESYKMQEHPAYRVVWGGFVRLFPLLERMAKLHKKSGPFVVALDGRAASGKTTMAAQLALVVGAGVIHMDDFFLPLSIRSENRLTEPGGNVHYERFSQEVLPKLADAKAFTYRRFDCSKMDFGDIQTVLTTEWRIVEGAYSCHPFFGDYADIKVFCDVEPKDQLHRIKQRNGAEKAKIFANRWIPLEERYFEHFQVLQNADVIL